MEKFFEGSYSNHGLPCLWECGGYGLKNGIERGYARIIANSRGNMQRAIFINRDGSEENINGNHALVPVRLNSFVLEADVKNQTIIMNLYVVSGFVPVDDKKVRVKVTTVNRCFNHIWDEKIGGFLLNMANAADRKARCLNCVQPFYVYWPPQMKRRGRASEWEYYDGEAYVPY